MGTDLVELVGQLRDTFERGVTKPYAWRVGQLEALQRMLVDNEEVFARALADDLGKHPVESWVTEIGFVGNEVAHLRRHLDGWLRPRRVPVPFHLWPARAKVVREPLGVVLVIAPWNYPLQLSLTPLAGALAAGNAVVLSPSEHAPATSRALAQLVPAHLDGSAVRIVEGGIPETTALLEQRWDHIFYTGGAAVGRVVLEAAAGHLTPVTLELGGKSPAFVDADADLEVAARRIAWAKFANAGQTCVAPDYVLATREVLDDLKPLLAKAIRDFYTADPSRSDAYGRVVDDPHFRRLTALVDPARVVSGGRSDAATRYIEPTVLDGVQEQDAVMQEEVFGPILPLLEVGGVDEAIERIVARDKPLALYVFTGNAETRRRFLTGTSSGGLTFNLPMAHLAVPGLPFGGVDASGMGSYHGEASLDVFSHTKPVLDSPTRPDLVSVAYPPFNALRRLLVRHVVAPRRRVR
ncbi:aldehyde dehydrogenase family protein [Intrasporangium sp.]|uniref:aldehyde dehydrogenase family protein n=1 Tax=Intrasporangium sp. TaxID=1925024 RepID=UPI003221E052